jgi:hypothetical protein
MSEKTSVQDEEQGSIARGLCSHRNYHISSLFNILFPPLATPPGDDPSTKMWVLSISHADKHDSEMVERWKDDMDGILIYVRF